MLKYLGTKKSFFSLKILNYFSFNGSKCVFFLQKNDEFMVYEKCI